ncbi:AbrB/MazE/SpoVT family DNA-binding domain-containing protein [uncultured Planococcus sp.]|uniref:AbrB/MazE/SpoVT family DNA-binding domain-containing protein n=1 Tax=uncultured Planococcus sp. TaxID=337815 RepID=UPI00262DBA2C|nr:AbrB/MazE/SpoVT family DNA-binding domain-containing protein [uncultured Planococcus sp.]
MAKVVVHQQAIVKKWGNNLGIRFNASIIDKTIIEVDTKVEISVLDNGTIMIKPLKKRKSLNEIIEGLTSDNQGEELIKGTVGEEL